MMEHLHLPMDSRGLNLPLSQLGFLRIAARPSTSAVGKAKPGKFLAFSTSPCNISKRREFSRSSSSLQRRSFTCCGGRTRINAGRPIVHRIPHHKVIQDYGHKARGRTSESYAPHFLTRHSRYLHSSAFSDHSSTCTMCPGDSGERNKPQFPVPGAENFSG
jgi:hypothetical protein